MHLVALASEIYAILWSLVAFAVLVVVRAIWFGVRDLRALVESTKEAKRRLGEAQAALEQDRNEMQERLARLQARSTEKED